MANDTKLSWLPTTKKELEARGWEQVDVILFSGDAYVDHPSFGAAVICRLLEAQGYRVALVPQPDWRGDFRDFTKLGRPRLFFAISAGCMDSMVNHYTANKRLRSDDAYTAGGKAGARPDYATVTYATILKQLYPDVPLVIGGIEASLRRLTHYDYWSDTLKPSILAESGADLLVYGMGEKPMLEICQRLKQGERLTDMLDVPQTAYMRQKSLGTAIQTWDEPQTKSVLTLYPHEECVADKHKQASNFRHIEEASNSWKASTLIQAVGDREIVVNPPFPTMNSDELDAVYELPFTRLPHPKYKDKPIPAYDMIKHSVNIHRGCFGGCAFCTISAHQGKFIVSRSKASVLREVERITKMDSFKGYISDLGGPSANMYRMSGNDISQCQRCKRSSCIHPGICTNLNTDHKPLIELYKAVDAIPGVKKSVIGSGIRYDLLVPQQSNRKGNKQTATTGAATNNHTTEYMNELVFHHVSGRLKVAPEHVSDAVLQIMRKPSFTSFKWFTDAFDALENERMKRSTSGRQQLVPYFISSHPGSTELDMAELAAETRRLHFKLEQVQDFTPTPMTLATEMYYTGLNPYTLKPVYLARTQEQKLAQREYFFWYKPEYRDAIIRRLKRLNRPDLIKRLFS